MARRRAAMAVRRRRRRRRGTRGGLLAWLCNPLVPKLCLGTHILRNSVWKRRNGVSKTRRSQTEFGNGGGRSAASPHRPRRQVQHVRRGQAVAERREVAECPDHPLVPRHLDQLWVRRAGVTVADDRVAV